MSDAAIRNLRKFIFIIMLGVVMVVSSYKFAGTIDPLWAIAGVLSLKVMDDFVEK